MSASTLPEVRLPETVAEQFRAAASLADPGDPALADTLYLRWYLGADGAQLADQPWQVPLAVAALEQAHPEHGLWRAASVRAVDPQRNGAVVVLDSGTIRVVGPPDVTRADPRGRGGLPLESGEQVLVAARHGGVSAQGWWRTWDRRWSPSRVAELGPLTRVYLAPAAQGFAGTVGDAVRVLLDQGVPWLLKAAAAQSMRSRPDRVVVYLPDAAAGTAMDRLATRLDARLDPVQPALTATVRPGLSWAQEEYPGEQDSSFGQQRCALVAQALEALAGLSAGDAPSAVSADAAVVAVAQAFRAAGLDPTRPHLRRTS